MGPTIETVRGHNFDRARSRLRVDQLIDRFNGKRLQRTEGSASVGTQTMLQQSSMEQPPQGLPQGYRDIPLEDRKKAKAFFDRGGTVAGTGNYDYAIEMYIQGLNLDPEGVEGHQALRDISLRRKAGGGKAIGMLQMM